VKGKAILIFCSQPTNIPESMQIEIAVREVLRGGVTQSNSLVSESEHASRGQLVVVS